jgi:hypothetical protein
MAGRKVLYSKRGHVSLAAASSGGQTHDETNVVPGKHDADVMKSGSSKS